MKKITICFLILLNINFKLFSQTAINDVVLNSYWYSEPHILLYFLSYDEDYSNNMVYYYQQLWSIFSRVKIETISDETIDFVIGLYEKTMSLDIPEKYKKMYINYEFGENGHEFFVKILSINRFMLLEKYIDDFGQENREIVKNRINKLKELFSSQDWNITVNYFNCMYSD